MEREKVCISRLELLKWLNDVMKTEFVRVEQCRDGIAYCLILEALYPSSISFSLFNWKPRGIDDCVRNQRIIQNAVKELKFDYRGDPEKLGRGSFRENYDFLLWLWHKWHAWIRGGSTCAAIARVPDSPPNADDTCLMGDLHQAIRHSKSVSSTQSPIQTQRQHDSTQSEYLKNLRRERDHYYKKLQTIEELMRTHFADTYTGRTTLDVISHTPEDFKPASQ